ncbi:unnamed protein product, partial [Sphacelaria rigidula]
ILCLYIFSLLFRARAFFFSSARPTTVRRARSYDLLYVVGSFDTICKACQQQYCSAGVWTGQEFDKV